MNTKILTTLKTLNLGLLIAAVCLVDSLATALYFQHLAATHHAAHFESNTWGITTFHWNDEYAQAPFSEDNLIPTPLVLKNAK